MANTPIPIPPEEERFATNIKQMVILVSQLVDKVAGLGYNIVSPSVVSLAGELIFKMDKFRVINGFIFYSHIHWDMIKARDRDFFTDHEKAGSIFRDIPLNSVTPFRDLFTLKDIKGDLIIDNNDITSLWAFFDSLVKICIKYTHKRRLPFSIKATDGTINHKYNDEKLNDFDKSYKLDIVDVTHHAKNWEIKLDFPLPSSQ